MTGRGDEPLRGDVIERGAARAYSWEWTDLGGPTGRSRLPWFGIFLVVFGLLLLLRLAFPALETAGSLLFLAVGVAFLFLGLVRLASGGGVGWQAALGALLALIGASAFAIPAFNELIWPIVLLALGGILLVRAVTSNR